MPHLASLTQEIRMGGQLWLGDSMQIYLLRHAVAVARDGVVYPNDDRPLTLKGRKNFKRTAAILGRVLKNVTLILTSPLSRAKETAEILRDSFGKKVKLKVVPLFTAGGQASQQAKYLLTLKNVKKIVVVGHEPDLTDLTRLLTGTAIILDFKKGAICRIDLPANPSLGKGIVKWFITPRIIERVTGK